MVARCPVPVAVLWVVLFWLMLLNWLPDSEWRLEAMFSWPLGHVDLCCSEVVLQCRQAMDELQERELLECPHKDVCEYLSNELNSITKDPLLRDLPSNPTIDEIKSRVALEKGKAIIVYLKRHSENEDESIRKFCFNFLWEGATLMHYWYFLLHSLQLIFDIFKNYMKKLFTGNFNYYGEHFCFQPWLFRNQQQ